MRGKASDYLLGLRESLSVSILVMEKKSRQKQASEGPRAIKLQK